MTYVDISMLIVQGAMQTGQHSEGGGGVAEVTKIDATYIPGSIYKKVHF